jgi:hypothetical protein
MFSCLHKNVECILCEAPVAIHNNNPLFYSRPQADKLTSSLNETIPLEEGPAPASEHTEAAGSRSTLKITIGVVAGILAIGVGVLIKFCAGGHCKRGEDRPEAVQTDVASQPQEEQEHSEAAASTSDVLDIEKD